MTENVLPQPSDVCGVIVSYNPSQRLGDEIDRLLKMIPQVIVVDNNSEPASLQWIDSMRSSPVEIIRNPRNLGIAAALNQGIQRAIELGYSWALTLDQDSSPADDMVERLCAVHDQVQDPDRIVILAPQIINRGLNKQTYYLRKRFGPFYERAYCDAGVLESVSTVITSGSMINLKIFQELGGYREDFFMDQVDTEFCLRALKYGFKIDVVCDANLDHTLGQRREVRVFGLRLYPTFHSPQRWYTISRNRLVLMRTYALTFPHWFTYAIVATFYTLARMLLAEDNRREKLRAIWRGLLDGLRGRMGEGS